MGKKKESNKVIKTAVEQEIFVNDRTINKRMIAELDVNKKFVYMNKSFRNILSYEKGELNGLSFELTLHSDMPICLCDNAFNVADKGVIWDGWIKSKTKHGESLWNSVFLMAIFDKDKRVTGYSVLKRDASEEKIESILEIYEEIRKTGKSNNFCG